MDMRKQPKPQIADPSTDRHSRFFSKRRKLPPLCDRFRVKVAPGVDCPEAMSARSRALAVWVLERWREDRKAGVTSEVLLQSSKQLFQTSRDELN